MLTSVFVYLLLLFGILFGASQSALGLEFECGDHADLSNIEGGIHIEYAQTNPKERIRKIFARGEIVSGDYKKFVAFLQEDCPWHDTIANPMVLHLDSPGGSLEEAVQIGLAIKPRGIRTYVDRDGACLSACTIVFMSGHASMGINRFIPWRRMHPSATIGFHAPYFDSDPFIQLDAEILKEKIGDFYRSAQLTTSRLLLLSAEARWPRSLMKVIMDAEPFLLNSDGTRSVNFTYVETLEQAGKWGIGLVGNKDIARKEFDEFDLAQSCLNFYFWDDQTSFGGNRELDDPSHVEAQVFDIAQSVSRIKLDYEERIRISNTLWNIDSIFCDWAIDGDRLVERDEGGFEEVYRQIPMELSSLPGHTPLKRIYEVAKEMNALVGKARASPAPIVVEETAYYDYQGSRIVAQFRPTSFTSGSVLFYYDKPSAEAKKYEIKSGTLLLEGNIVFGHMLAYGPKYNTDCATFANVVVEGPFTQASETLVLTGRAPTYDLDCNAVGYEENNSANKFILTRIESAKQ